MSGAAAVQVRVPFLDLKAQYASIKDEVDEALRAVLESANFVGGKWVERFEDEFARYVGAKYAVGVGSGTAALELAFKAARLGPGDEVIVPANSFFATAEAATNIGAKVVFADVDPATFHLDPRSVEKAITSRTRAIVPVHLYGRAADLTELERLADHEVRPPLDHDLGQGRQRCLGVEAGEDLAEHDPVGLRLREFLDPSEHLAHQLERWLGNRQVSESCLLHGLMEA